MRELTKTIRAMVMEFDELLHEDQELLRRAKRARENAQATYYEYAVGAAIASAKHTIHVGCNVERCTGTQISHAEQVATDNMVVSLGPAKILTVALVGAPARVSVILPPQEITNRISCIEEVPVPCGHCLQIIWENCFDDSNVRLIALASGGEVVVTTIGDAFPMRFGPADLGVQY